MKTPSDDMCFWLLPTLHWPKDDTDSGFLSAFWLVSAVTEESEANMPSTMSKAVGTTGRDPNYEKHEAIECWRLPESLQAQAGESIGEASDLPFQEDSQDQVMRSCRDMQDVPIS